MESNILNYSFFKWWQRHPSWQAWILTAVLPVIVILCWLLSIKILLPFEIISAIIGLYLLCRLVLTKPQSALIILLIFDFFISMLGNDFVRLLPPQIVWFSDGILFILSLYVLISVVRTGRWIKTVIDLPVLFFTAVIILSAMANRTGLLPTFLALRFYLKFPLFYLILVNLRLEPQTFQSYKNWFLGLVLLQVPVTMVEFGLLHWRQDEVGGTLGPGGTTQMGLMCILAQCVFLIAAIDSSKNRLKYLIYTVLLFIPPILGSVNANFIFLILLLGYLFLKKLFSRDAPRMLLMTPLLILTLFGSLMIFSGIEPKNTAMMILRHPKAVWEVMFSGELARGTSINRLVQIPSSFQKAMENPGKFFIGEGPYQYTETSKIVGSEAEFQTLRYITGIGNVQISRTLLELGIFGLIASAFLMLPIWRLARKFTRAALGENQLILGRSVELMWVFFAVLSSAYGPVWNMEHVALPFWVWVASLNAATASQLEKPETDATKWQ